MATTATLEEMAATIAGHVDPPVDVATVLDDIRAKAAETGVEPETFARQMLGIDELASTELVTVDNERTAVTRALAVFSDEQVQLLKAAGQMPKDASPAEVEYAVAVARSLDLDPLRKQIQFIRFEKSAPITPTVSIDGLQAIAARTRAWAGVDLPVYERDESGNVTSASVTVYRLVQGTRCAFSATVQMAEFAKRKANGDLNKFWATMPMFMLAKVARAQAIRMGFPEETSGLYAEEEVE